jgi:glycosyltransferase involved in cell wall biosynthesis
MKILMVFNLPPSKALGGARIQLELGEAMRSLGHHVDFLTGADIFPQPPRSQVEALLRSFARSSLPELRQRARHYDVIDALEGCVTATKSDLRFDGALVARSLGLVSAYERWRADAEHRFPGVRGRYAGRLPRKISLRYHLRETLYSRRNADLFFVPNSAERDELAAEIGVERVCMLPFGLTTEQLRAFAQVAASRPRSGPLRVVFIGTWDARKGKFDFPDLIRLVRRERADAHFTFLGTHASAEHVLADLDMDAAPWIRVVPAFEPADLPEALADATVGVFPSYQEGFGFAVLEKLAAGLPVVAYDVPGPRDILGPLDRRLLVPPSDVAGLARRVIDADAGRFVSPDACTAYVSKFRWDKLAASTVDGYSRALFTSQPE